MDYKELIDILQDESNPNVLDYIDDAVTAINDLLARAESEEARAEKAERERDAAIKMLRFCKAADEECAFAAGEFSAPCPDYKTYQRLAEIENILGDDYDLDRLKEIVQADREGRCITLPCKVGDTIYTIGASICKWREIDHCDEYCDGQQYRDCWEGESTVLERKFGLYDLVSINKTVFLTRKEAESALEKMKEDK